MSIVECDTKALIFKDRKILVLKDNSVKGRRIIDIPGGRMHYGLTTEENLKKELVEELSIDVEIKKLIGVWQFFHAPNNNQVICITYLCEPLSDNIDLGNNPDKEEIISEYFWITPEEFLKLESDNPIGLESLKKLVKNYFKLD